MQRFIPVFMALLLSLSACDSIEIPSWAGGSDNKPKLKGDRIAILNEASDYKPDADLAAMTFLLPAAEANESWMQSGGAPSSFVSHPALAADINRSQSARIGEGYDWSQKIFSLPVIAGGVLFAMDARGYVSAHSASDISNVLWVSKAAVDEDENELLGGGLAYDNGKLFATTGQGKIIAINPQNGEQLWKQAINIPIRVAPKAAAGKVIAMTVDNQTFALSADTGDILWSHRGYSESAGFIADAAPSVTDSIVVAPYSSGQVVGIDIENGQELWSETLILTKRTMASDIFSGIGGNPVIDGGMVYAVSNNGLLAAIEMTRGQRVWDQEISSGNTPFVAGDAIFVITRSQEVLALSRTDGRIKWVHSLPAYENEERKRGPINWRGPVLAGGKLYAVSELGEMTTLDPMNGAEIGRIDVPSRVVGAPIVAGGSLYLVTQDAEIYSYK